MPVILLPASVPPPLEKKLMESYFLAEEGTAIIQAPTDRPEIRLHTINLDPLSPLEALNRLVDLLRSRLADNERMLVFFFSCAMAKSFAMNNDYTFFHSSGAKEDSRMAKVHNLGLWDDGTMKVMVCTSVFGVGIDRPNVCFTVIFNLTYSLITMMQMVGRAGRDGRESHVFFTSTKKKGHS